MDDALGTRIISKEDLDSLQERIQKIIDNPPNIVCVNVVLNGAYASKHLICREMIMAVNPGITEKEADWYLVCSGAEREILRLTVLGSRDTDD